MYVMVLCAEATDQNADEFESPCVRDLGDMVFSQCIR